MGIRILITIIFLLSAALEAQVGIGTTTPSNAAMLEIDGGDATQGFRGFMPPRVPTETDRDAISPTTSDIGLIVFVQSTGCLDIWNGTSWENIYCLNTASSANDIWINELHYDNFGADVGEFVEIAGTAGLDVTGYSLKMYNGSDGLSYTSTILAGTIPNQNNGYGTMQVTFASSLQNGNPDGVALIDSSGTLIQFLSYGGTFTAANGEAAGVLSIDIGVSEAGMIGESLQLIGTGNVYADFTWTGPTGDSPGNVNSGQTFN